jgi:hypothetical protein
MNDDPTNSDQHPIPPTLEYRSPAADESVPMLEYRPASADRRGFTSGWQLAVGVIGALLLMMGSVLLAFAAALGSRSGAGIFWLSVGGATFLINYIAIWTYRKTPRQSLAIGMWIGFGIALLVNGMCFAIASGGFR